MQTETGKEHLHFNKSLEVSDLTKYYPVDELLALNRVSMSFEPGHVYALLGENGAGKTTAIRLIGGEISPTAGKILVDGIERKIISPLDARINKIGIVHQYPSRIEGLHVWEQLILGDKGPQLLDSRPVCERIKVVADSLEICLDPMARVEDLTLAQLQSLELIRAISHQSQIILLDEPTSVLTPQETPRLFSTLRRLAGDGKTVVFVSHIIPEVLSNADIIYILRHGEFVKSTKPSAETVISLAEAMVGRPIDLNLKREDTVAGKVLLKVSELTVAEQDRQLVRLANLSVSQGEIVAIVGINGNGQRELAEAIIGERNNGGEIVFDGQSVDCIVNGEVNECGIGYIPEDVTAFAIAPDLSVEENLTSGILGTSSLNNLFGVIDLEKRRSFARALVDEYQIQTSSLTIETRKLSGGNRQKLVIARELSRRNLRFVLAVNPFHGLDLATTLQVEQIFLNMRKSRVGILLALPNLDDAFELADKIYVMQGGKLSEPITRDNFDRDKIGMMMAGVGV